MTKSFEDMMYLFSCAAVGTDPVISHKIDIKEIYMCSLSHGIWSTVFLSVKKIYDKDNSLIDEKTFMEWDKNLKLQVYKNIVRNAAVHTAIDLLENNNVECCLLKGEVLANLYNVPAYRISADTDILIDKNDEKKAYSLLESINYEIKTRLETSHHTSCYHPIGGVIELHLRLYDELFEDIWFDNKAFISEEFRRVAIDDGKTVTTLGITDTAVFITLHFIKHFLIGGIGLRSVMDILLYMIHNKNEIDWGTFDRLMKHLKYDKFVDNIIGIGVEYFHFNKSDFKEYFCNPDTIKKILLNSETGNKEGLEDFYRIYNQERFNRFKKGNYNKYMYKWWKPSILTSIFLPRNIIAEKFSYVKKHPVLLPIAWLHRITRLIVRLLKRENSISHYVLATKLNQNNEIIQKRMELLRELDMI